MPTVETLRAKAAEAEKKAAEIEAALAAAQVEESQRREERSQEFDRRTLDTWEAENARLHGKYADAMQRFTELLSEEPWFQAFVESRTANEESFHLIQFAGNAKIRTEGEHLRDAFKPGGADSALLALIQKAAEAAAKSNGYDYEDALQAKRERFISGEAE
ncbi:hypothetical protein ACH470_15510 [Streptomyces bottropensis]|uniref:hypothetical protein n=1 Tax=Streptomyces bottropensis TaxID=42235 RepID=UPI00378FD014